MSMIERVARALCQRDWGDETSWEVYLDDARAAIAAMKYSDGADEPLLIEAAQQEKMDPVGLSCAWDAMIEAALREGSK